MKTKNASKSRTYTKVFAPVFKPVVGIALLVGVAVLGVLGEADAVAGDEITAGALN
jgi:hypothetical protein